MSDREQPSKARESVDEYQAPQVESHLDEKEIEREVAYAGDQTVVQGILEGGDQLS